MALGYLSEVRKQGYQLRERDGVTYLDMEAWLLLGLGGHLLGHNTEESRSGHSYIKGLLNCLTIQCFCESDGQKCCLIHFFSTQNNAWHTEGTQ